MDTDVNVMEGRARRADNGIAVGPDFQTTSRRSTNKNAAKCSAEGGKQHGRHAAVTIRFSP